MLPIMGSMDIDLTLPKSLESRHGLFMIGYKLYHSKIIVKSSLLYHITKMIFRISESHIYISNIIVEKRGVISLTNFLSTER